MCIHILEGLTRVDVGRRGTVRPGSGVRGDEAMEMSVMTHVTARVEFRRLHSEQEFVKYSWHLGTGRYWLHTTVRLLVLRTATRLHWLRYDLRYTSRDRRAKYRLPYPNVSANDSVLQLLPLQPFAQQRDLQLVYPSKRVHLSALLSLILTRCLFSDLFHHALAVDHAIEIIEE